MKFLSEINELELAMIELEYAVADFRDLMSTPLNGLLTRSAFDALSSQLVAVNRAVKMAASALPDGELQRVV